ncbi:MAG: NfeD family protein, partial [Candidatus Wukongarchaeota archaeon]|nr:NfeD family protein [Candidatus Wukongarchaeota archaeon]
FHFVLRPVFLRFPVSGPVESLIGLKGEAVTDLTPYGKVKIGDTLWRAEAKGGHISRGETVETVNVDEKKLVLKVLKTGNE